MSAEGTAVEGNVVNSRSGVLWAWVLIHLVGWSVLPCVTNTALHLDTIEALAWGKEWAWGYDKHPPLSAWAAEVFGYLGDWGLYFLSQLCIVLGGLGIWLLGGEFGLPKWCRAVGLVLLDAIYFYQYISPEFNVNYLQLPFWSFGWWFAFVAARRESWLMWTALGVCVGLGALTKYFAVVLVVPLLVAFWQRGMLFEQLKRPGLYWAGIISLVVFIPHLLWMKDHEWLTINYGLRRASEEDVAWWFARLWYPLEFALSQIAILLPLVAFVYWNRGNSRVEKDLLRGLSGLVCGGYGLIFTMSLLFGWRPVTMWAAPMPLAAGLWFAARWLDPSKAKRAAVMSLSFGLLGFAAYGIVFGLSPLFRDKPHRVNYDGVALAEAVEEIWANQNELPLDYVISGEWLGGLVAWYGADRASVLIDASFEKSAFIEEARLKERGAIVVWEKNVDSRSTKHKSLARKYPGLLETFPSLVMKDDIVIAWPRRRDGKAGRFGVAYLPPKEME